MKKTRNDEQTALLGVEEGELLEQLTERVERAVETIQKLRKERETLKSRLDEVEGQLAEHGEAAGQVSSLQEELDRFRGERDEIRSRITRALDALASLDEE